MGVSLIQVKAPLRDTIIANFHEYQNRTPFFIPLGGKVVQKTSLGKTFLELLILSCIVIK